MVILIILSIILIYLIYKIITPAHKPRALCKRKKKYEDTFGHSTRNIAEIIENETDVFVLGEIHNFNLNQPAIANDFYDTALQQAIANSLENPERVIDRLTTDFVPIRNPNDPDYFVRAIRNDPQNVHDTNVVRQVGEKYDIINDNSITDGNANNSQIDLLKKKCRTHEKGQIALIAINKIEADPAYSSNVNATDYDCLIKVLQRAEKIPALYDSLIENLANCVDTHQNENDHKPSVVCTTGRVANIMDSLTLIDPEAGAPLVTTEIARKEILAEAAKFAEALPEDYDEDEARDALEKKLRENFVQLDAQILTKLVEEAKFGI